MIDCCLTISVFEKHTSLTLTLTLTSSLFFFCIELTEHDVLQVVLVSVVCDTTDAVLGTRDPHHRPIRPTDCFTLCRSLTPCVRMSCLSV